MERGHVLPEASGRKTSESFIRKDGDEGIERKTEARSNERNVKNNNNKMKNHMIQQQTSVTCTSINKQGWNNHIDKTLKTYVKGKIKQNTYLKL